MEQDDHQEQHNQPTIQPPSSQPPTITTEPISVPYLQPPTVPSATATSKAVLNLSTHVTTDYQIQALELGLKFAPAPKDIPDPLEFFDNFEQRCTWVYKKFTGVASSHLPTAMQDRLDIMREKLDTVQPTSFDSNISLDIRQAIEELRRDKSIIIREADKGSCIVIMNTSQYIEVGYQHLSDRTIYHQLDHDRTLEVAHKSNWAIGHHQRLGTLGHVEEYTQPTGTRTQELYFLKKVHKNPHRIRPIVSCSSGPTEKISGYLCRLLSPHLDNVRSLVKNSQQVVQTIESLDLSAHPNITLVSLDVESLYLSIPQGVGIEMVLQRVFPTSPPLATTNSFKNLVRDLLKVVIKDNTFRFHDRFYNQVKGVAMGTKCAPPFANLFLAILEEKALESWQGINPLVWLRFLDDVFMLWPGDDQELQTFLTHLNSQMNHINFTISSSQESTIFLDLEIYKGHRFRRCGVLDTKLHIKPTNSQSFLHFQSCHPASTFTTIIKGELLRALRATSDVESYTIIVAQLLKRFLQRGYPKELFLQVADSLTFGQGQNLLASHPKQALLPNVTIFSIRHHPALDTAEIWQILQDEETPFKPRLSDLGHPLTGTCLSRPRPRADKETLKDQIHQTIKDLTKHFSLNQPLPHSNPSFILLPTLNPLTNFTTNLARRT